MRIFLGATLLLVSWTAQAVPIELITNGNFETGGFVGWTITDQAGGSGTWTQQAPGSLTPLSGNATSAAGGSPHGLLYAVSDQTGPGAHALTQSFTVGAGTSALALSFDMFANDSDGGPLVDPLGLDFSGGPNQHARVDILFAGAGGLGTTPADVFLSLIAPMVDPQITNPNPFTTYSFDLLALGLTAGTYQIRFGEVDNQLFLNMGVDNVSILATVPEPGILALMAVALLGFGLGRKKRIS